MIYCRKKEQLREDMAVYCFGIDTQNMSGEVVFYSDGRAFQINALPAGENLSEITLGKIYTKYHKAFKNRDFPERISFEC